MTLFEVRSDTMVTIPQGSFDMGSTAFYADEGPVRRETVQAYRLDAAPVTNRQFAFFVLETDYVTTAQRPLPEAEFPGLSPQEREAGSLVFTATPGPVPLDDWQNWWRWVPGASWRHPSGPNSDLAGKAEHPVVQVSYEDASAYAAWAGKRLPTEVEWEYAAWAGHDGATYAWGDERFPDGRVMANTYVGRFPYDNQGASGWRGTSPIGSFPRNDFGLSDMIGNTWEWTSSPYATPVAEQHSCCPPAQGVGASDPRALKGGSHLCAPEYCLRYRPAARSSQSVDSATTHIGFRCAADLLP